MVESLDTGTVIRSVDMHQVPRSMHNMGWLSTYGVVKMVRLLAAYPDAGEMILMAYHQTIQRPGALVQHGTRPIQ